MRPFELYILLWPACAIFIFCLFVTFSITRNPVASILAAFVKSGVFFIYFGLLFDGTFIFLDDMSYLRGGQDLLEEGVGVFNLADNWDFVLTVGGGNHFAYYLYNTYAFRFFGVGYYAPVACNILLTVLIAYFGSRLAVREFRLSTQKGKWFYIFLLFQPDILAWSNIMNGKDILVLLLHVLLLQAVALFYRNRLRDALLLGAPIVMMLFFLRFYVPVLFVVALLLGTVFAGRIRNRTRILYLLLGSILAGFIFYWLGQAYIQYAVSIIQEYFVNPLYGFIRMLLTPIPFNTEPEYAFLNIPAVFHWLLMFPATIGAVSLIRRREPFSRFFIMYLFVFIGLYSIFGELQGPRHRVQLDYALAILQFTGLLIMVKNIRFTHRKERTDKSFRTQAERE